MKVGKLLRDVRVIITENEQLQPLMEVGDQMALERDTLLKTLVPIAVDKIHAIAPIEMLTDIAKDASSLSWHSTEIDSQIAELPSDYLRLVYVKASGWHKGVIDVVDEESATYKTFVSPLQGVRPSVYNPAAAVVKSYFGDSGSGRGGNFVEICPKGSSAVVRYIPKVNDGAYDGEGGDGMLDDDDNITIAGECYWCIVYTIANLYFVSVDDDNRAKMMAKEAADIIESYREKVNKR